MELGNRHFAGLDFLISPVAPGTAFPAELPSPGNDPERPFDHIGFTMAYNMTGQPAASINCGYGADGLPIGLQIVGRRFDDVGVLRVSRLFERIRAPQRPWPMFENGSFALLDEPGPSSGYRGRAASAMGAHGAERGT